MKISRREIFKTVSLASLGVAAGAAIPKVTNATGASGSEQNAPPTVLPPAFDSLKPLGDRVKPIRPDEYQQRIAHAQKLMTDSNPQFEIGRASCRERVFALV